MGRRVRYCEGDWFAVPLLNGGFAVGVVARSNSDGVLLGYFFGPARSEEPTLADVADLHPGDAVLVRKFGHLGLVQGKWPVLGQLRDWDRDRWRMPVFVRYEELTGRVFHAVYDENDPNRLLREYEMPAGVAEQGPQDGLMGSGFTERVLTRMLAS